MKRNSIWLRKETMWIGLASLLLTLIYVGVSWGAAPAASHYVSMSEKIGKIVVLVKNSDVWIYFFQGIVLFIGLGFTVYYMVQWHRPSFVTQLKEKTHKLRESSDFQSAVNFEIESLANRYLVIDLMVGGAPIAGLLGTVIGLVQVFSEQTQVEHVTMQTIAGGMYVAMVTTVCGLIVALIGIVSRHLLNARLAELRDILSGAK